MTEAERLAAVEAARKIIPIRDAKPEESDASTLIREFRSDRSPEAVLALADECERLRTELRTAIQNCHLLNNQSFVGLQRWSIVGSMFDHGSGIATQLCIEAGVDPNEIPIPRRQRKCSPK